MTHYSIVVGVKVPRGGLDQNLPIGSATIWGFHPVPLLGHFWSSFKLCTYMSLVKTMIATDSFEWYNRPSQVVLPFGKGRNTSKKVSSTCRCLDMNSFLSGEEVTYFCPLVPWSFKPDTFIWTECYIISCDQIKCSLHFGLIHKCVSNQGH